MICVCVYLCARYAHCIMYAEFRFSGKMKVVAAGQNAWFVVLKNWHNAPYLVFRCANAVASTD